MNGPETGSPRMAERGAQEKRLIAAAEEAVSLLDSVEWLDRATETNAADVQHELEEALAALSTRSALQPVKGGIDRTVIVGEDAIEEHRRQKSKSAPEAVRPDLQAKPMRVEMFARLYFLAFHDARRRHYEAADSDGYGRDFGHAAQFSGCPHPDCAATNKDSVDIPLPCGCFYNVALDLEAASPECLHRVSLACCSTHELALSLPSKANV